MDDKTIAIRCDHDGLKMGEVKDGHLILRTKHHGETHFKIVQLRKLAALTGEGRGAPPVGKLAPPTQGSVRVAENSSLG